MRKIGLLVGNGFTTSATEYLGNDFNYNTTNFFGWDIKTPGNEESMFLDKLPMLKEALSRINKQDIQLKDFYKIEKIINEIESYNSSNYFTSQFNSGVLLCEVQHYLAIAFSLFQLEFEKYNISDWKWVEWFKKYGREVLFCLSFNYDLILEKTLDECSLKYRRVGIIEEKDGILILKPHGSIDYEIDNYAISMPPITYPLKNAIYRNNCPIIPLDKKSLLKPRKEVDIVLPTEYSVQLNYQWVKPGYECLTNEGNIFTHFIIVGISYWECDRPEIDYVLNCLNPDTKIILADPKPKEDLLCKLTERFSTVIKWESGPLDIND